MILVVLISLPTPERPDLAQKENHRFVLYLPMADRPNLVGTFTGWKPVPMHKVGATGYWTLTLKVPEGEHRYSYLVGSGRQIADPTIVTREHDDFGGENSVILIGGADASSPALRMETIYTARDLARQGVTSATTTEVIDAALVRGYDVEAMRTL